MAKQEFFESTLASQGLRVNDEGLIRWADHNPRHPRNWSTAWKAYSSIVILSLELITTIISTAGTSAALQATSTYDISDPLSIMAFTSTYLIGQGMGAVFFPPYSESFGRKHLYIISALGYCICCVMTAAVPSLAIIIVARFVMGVFSAIPSIVVAGSMEDLFNIQARVFMTFIWTLLGDVGLCIGPIYSTYITFCLGWRWVFWISAILVGILFLLCIPLRETRPSRLLEREVTQLRKQYPTMEMKTLNPDRTPDLRSLIQLTLTRPLRLLFTEPIIIIAAIMFCIICATYYLFADALLIIFAAYGWSASTSSLAFIPFGFGHFLGFFARWYDHRTLSRLKEEGKPIEPESKLFFFNIATPLLAAGFWILAWTVPPASLVHPAVPFLALVLIGFSLNEIIYALATYLTDSYTVFAASGFAGIVLARATVSATVLPLTPSMYGNLGANYATTILAGLTTLFALVPFIFTRYGHRIRKASKFARFSSSTYLRTRVENDVNVLNGKTAVETEVNRTVATETVSSLMEEGESMALAGIEKV